MTVNKNALEPRALRRVFAAHPSGVTVVAGLVNGLPVGLAASTFVPVSLDPPLVSACVARTSTTWPALRDAPAIGVSVLGAHQEDIGRRVGARTGDRFAGVSWRAATDGAVLLDGAVAAFECTIDRHVDAGDHEIVLLAIREHEHTDDLAPLVFHGSRYRALA
ncbi:flavin reductase family protein [Frankia sp. AgB1.9]|uniref:flavin reductase family protein n=1 Tax=unclassified Frankia TaxID=2632575 RepID=UPI001931ADEE|nr:MULTISPECIES: flavin reductase family protein [unclassified Frankia]MBL7491544.1 flavin reductase family protein [Frankia sp. AgW1.1]MBL7553815.1 flavin reductase family protein [Frankia sp. AgB1.9]MBL7617915.1 flavin reductase family protein [Frankia sp. AgB1.8]